MRIAPSGMGFDRPSAGRVIVSADNICPTSQRREAPRHRYRFVTGAGAGRFHNRRRYS
jgi:hypothetical protein